MPTGGTIAALGTASGMSARAIIRISGPDAHAVVTTITSTPHPTRGIVPTRINLTKDLSFPAQLIWYNGPKSYTGEDVAELVLVGNPTLIERTLDLILKIPGLRRAEPGEFSARAYLNERLTLAQAEGVALRIAAGSSQALDAATALMDGSQGDRCHEWAQEIALLLALVESGVDFTDQDDVVPITPRDLLTRLESLRSQLVAEIGLDTGTKVHATLPEVVLVGKPNAGKSALFNALLNRQRAVVSDQAGTTRDAITEPLDLEHEIPGAGTTNLTDLAGLADHAVDSIDALAQSEARKYLRNADALIWCDPTGRFEDHDNLVSLEIPIIRVRTKSDLILNDPTTPSSAISVCALDGHHLGTLRRAIVDAITNGAGLGVGAFVPRHRRAITRTESSIQDAIQWVDPNARALLDPELVASGLRDALDTIGELTGHITPDDVLGRVFATFCVGK